MLISLLVGFAAGMLVGAAIELCINVVSEWLSSRRAVEKVRENLDTPFNRLLVDTVNKMPEEVSGEVIHMRALDADGDTVANITINAAKGSALYDGQVICNNG